MQIEYKIQRMICADAYELYKIDRIQQTISCIEVPYEAIHRSDRDDPQTRLGQKKLEILFNYYARPLNPCSLGCDIVDSGMKWSYCRNCEQQYEFKNWEWVAMRKAQ